MPTAAYTAQADAHSRRVQWVVEIDLDRCSLNYTTSPCTAIDQGDGSRCYYSFPTCQDVTNYDRTTKTWRFCLRSVPWPDNSSPAYPYLERIVPVPQEIDPKKLAVYPEKISVRFAVDHDPPAPDSDKTLFNTATTGEFWRNLFSRNRNYPGRPMRIKRGFYASGFALSDFLQIGPEYKLKEVKFERETVTVTAESPLADLDKKQVPWTISEDNTVQDDPLTIGATTLNVKRGSEFPDPANYTRNNIYVQIENEILEVTAISTNALTVVRGSLNTAAAQHVLGTRIRHVALIGVDNGISTAASATTIGEALQDLLEWADVAAADVDDTTFDAIDTEIWPDADVLYDVISKPAKIAKHCYKLRTSRSIIMYMDENGKWAAKVAQPNSDLAELTDDNFVHRSVSVEEDEESRITRAALWYDPAVDNPGDEPKDYNKGIVVIDSELETVNNFGEPREDVVGDPFLDPGIQISKAHNLLLKKIARLRYGTRTFRFRLDVKDGELNVGEERLLTTRQLLTRAGVPSSRPVMVVKKREISEGINEYEAMDTQFGGAYFRIGPNTMAEDYDNATEEDKAYGYWGDTDNRVGDIKDEGYIFG